MVILSNSWRWSVDFEKEKILVTEVWCPHISIGCVSRNPTRFSQWKPRNFPLWLCQEWGRETIMKYGHCVFHDKSLHSRKKLFCQSLNPAEGRPSSYSTLHIWLEKHLWKSQSKDTKPHEYWFGHNIIKCIPFPIPQHHTSRVGYKNSGSHRKNFKMQFLFEEE